MANLVMELEETILILTIDTHRLKHRVLELEEQQLQFLLVSYTHAQFLITVL